MFGLDPPDPLRRNRLEIGQEKWLVLKDLHDGQGFEPAFEQYKKYAVRYYADEAKPVNLNAAEEERLRNDFIHGLDHYKDMLAAEQKLQEHANREMKEHKGLGGRRR